MCGSANDVVDREAMVYHGSNCPPVRPPRVRPKSDLLRNLNGQDLTVAASRLPLTWPGGGVKLTVVRFSVGWVGFGLKGLLRRYPGPFGFCSMFASGSLVSPSLSPALPLKPEILFVVKSFLIYYIIFLNLTNYKIYKSLSGY